MKRQTTFKRDQRVNMDINHDLWIDVSIMAAKQQTTKRAIVERALKDYLAASAETESTQAQ